MIYDESTGKYYRIYRNFWGNLKLKEMVFVRRRVFLTEGDFIFTKSELKKYVSPPEPPTPQ